MADQLELGLVDTRLSPPKKSKLVRNRVQCRKCGDIIESKYRHDFVMCKCESIFTDGGLDYIRRGGHFEDVIDLSEWYDE